MSNADPDFTKENRKNKFSESQVTNEKIEKSNKLLSIMYFAALNTIFSQEYSNIIQVNLYLCAKIFSPIFETEP